jgi:hypothetical protein
MALGGCQPLERLGECRRVARTVNPVLSLIDDARRKKPDDPGTYRTIAAQYEFAAKAIDGMGLRSKRILDSVSEYQKVLRDGGRDARQFADALDSHDPARITAMRAQAAKTIKRESTAVNHFEGACKTR